MPADHEEGHPKFIEAMDAIERLEASGQANPKAILPWMLQAVEYASERLRIALFREIYRSGGFPETKHFTPDGKPIFTAEQLAERFDVTVEDITSNIRLMALGGILVIPPPDEGRPADPPHIEEQPSIEIDR
jgi:hypothetical protein